MTLFVGGLAAARPAAGSCADTMNCSLRTNYSRAVNRGRVKSGGRDAYQDSDNGIMVRVFCIVRELFDDIEQMLDEVVLNENCSRSTN